MLHLSARSNLRRVFITTDAVGGVWTQALDLVRGLGEIGIETTLAVLGPRASAGQLHEARSIASLSVVETPLQLDWLAVSSNELKATTHELPRLALAAGADLAHLHAPALAACERWPLPLVVTAHSCVGTWWQAVRGGPVPSDHEWKVSATGEGLRSADRVIAPSRSFAATLRTYYRFARIDPVLNGRTPISDNGPAQRSGVLAAGRLWDPGKDVATLDAAAAISRARIAAAGPLSGPNGQTQKLTCVAHLGALDPTALARRMRSAAAFVSTSVYEPFGLAVLEAAQAGAPLVLTDIAAHRELWEGAALFFPPRRPDLLAAVLDRLVADETLQVQLGAASRQMARRYSAERMTRSTLIAYARAVADREQFRAREVRGVGAR